MPSISGSGKARPQSTTRMRPAASIRVMFLPTSPTPPSGMMRRGSVILAPGRASSAQHRPCSAPARAPARESSPGPMPPVRLPAPGERPAALRAAHGCRRRASPAEGLVQRGSRMVHREDEVAARSAQLPVHARDARPRQVALQRVAPQRDDHGRVQGRLLAVQVARPGGDLLRLGVAVARRVGTSPRWR